MSPEKSDKLARKLGFRVVEQPSVQLAPFALQSVMPDEEGELKVVSQRPVEPWAYRLWEAACE